MDSRDNFRFFNFAQETERSQLHMNSQATGCYRHVLLPTGVVRVFLVSGEVQVVHQLIDSDSWFNPLGRLRAPLRAKVGNCK